MRDSCCVTEARFQSSRFSMRFQERQAGPPLRSRITHHVSRITYHASLAKQLPSQPQLEPIHLAPVCLVIVAAQVKHAVDYKLAHFALKRMARVGSLIQRRVG